MAEQQETPENDELEGINDEDARRLLDKPEDKSDDGKKDEDGDEELGPAGLRAYERAKEERRTFREERDRAKAELIEAQKALSKYSDRDKTETQRLTEERDAAKAELAQVTSAMKRRELAEELAPDHATPAQIRQVAKRLRGDTDAELEADAKELFELVAPEPPRRPAGKPQERGSGEGRPRGGGDPDENDPGEMDPRKLAARIPRAR